MFPPEAARRHIIGQETAVSWNRLLASTLGTACRAPTIERDVHWSNQMRGAKQHHAPNEDRGSVAGGRAGRPLAGIDGDGAGRGTDWARFYLGRRPPDVPLPRPTGTRTVGGVVVAGGAGGCYRAHRARPTGGIDRVPQPG